MNRTEDLNINTGSLDVDVLWSLAQLYRVVSSHMLSTSGVLAWASETLTSEQWAFASLASKQEFWKLSNDPGRIQGLA